MNAFHAVPVGLVRRFAGAPRSQAKRRKQNIPYNIVGLLPLMFLLAVARPDRFSVQRPND
jgi:hypothetical protein